MRDTYIVETVEENNSMDLSLPNDNESCGEIYWGYSAAAADNGTADKQAREVDEDKVVVENVEEEEDEWSEENWRSK